MGPPNSATETPGCARAAAPGGEGRRESPCVSARRGRSPPATGRLLSAPRVPPPPTPAARVAAPPAPPLVAAARLGAPTPRGFSSTRLPDPAGGLRGGRDPGLSPRARTRYLRAVRPPRSCQSCGHEEGERPPSGPFGPSRDAVGRDVPKRRPGGGSACSCRGRAGPGTPGPREWNSARGEADADGTGAGGAGWGAAGGGAGLPPGDGRALSGAGSAAEARRDQTERALSCRRHDHTRALLHLRKDRRQQVGGLPGAAAGRVHRGVRRRAGWGRGERGSRGPGLRD